jgi:hypothetical protein
MTIDMDTLVDADQRLVSRRYRYFVDIEAAGFDKGMLYVAGRA